MMYPAAVVTMATLVVAVILWKVVPTFAELFTGLGAELPLPTRVVIGLSRGIEQPLRGFSVRDLAATL